MGYSLSDLNKWLRDNPDLTLVVEDGIDLADTDVGTLTRFARARTSEHDLQVSLIAEADRRAAFRPEWGLIFAIPNGGLRSKSVAGKLKAEGVRAGIPDLLLPVARHGYHGLFIELKVRDNKPSREQLAKIDSLRAQGYYATVVWDDLIGALNLIEWYLERK